jgi:hypothetical protein
MSTLRALNGRTKETGEIVMTRCVVRKRTMNGTPVEALFVFLLRENFTGTVTLGMSQGHVRTIAVEDRQEING